MKSKIIAVNMAKDTLAYTSPLNASVDMAHGVVVGFVGGLMAVGYTFGQAMKAVKDLLPADYRIECIPEAWRSELLNAK